MPRGRTGAGTAAWWRCASASGGPMANAARLLARAHDSGARLRNRLVALQLEVSWVGAPRSAREDLREPAGGLGQPVGGRIRVARADGDALAWLGPERA